MNDFETLLRTSDLRLTQTRRIVFGVLKDTSLPLSLSGIALRCSGINRSSVYRTIDTFIAIGVVKTVHIGWKKQYELTELFSPHHHHFRCSLCSELLHVEDSKLEDAIEAVSQKYNFIIQSHHFEIEGICEKCQDKSQVAGVGVSGVE